MNETLLCNPQGDPATHFAPAERVPADEVRRIAAELADSPILSAVLAAFGGIVAVLNRHRQILAVNDGLLAFLEISDGKKALGLRPGEALGCVHAEDWPGGCGTSRFCSTCGAAIAIVVAQREERPQERECLLTLGEPGMERSVELLVRAVPLILRGHSLVLLLLRDIRDEKRREAIEQVFLHDVNNLLAGLAGASAGFEHADVQTYPELASRVETLTYLLADEIRSHTLLLDAEKWGYTPRPKPLDVEELLRTLQELFEYHPCARGRELDLSVPDPIPHLKTDEALLHRVLVNMVKNAFEATPPGGIVRLGVEDMGSDLIFRVHNSGWMEEKVAMRVFQRHFSTKKEPGRGLGTYGMKLLGERCLGGRVSFVTAESEGTTFSFRIPKGGG